MPKEPLTAREREEIHVGIERDETDGQIGVRLGRHRSTINTEINRNGGRMKYSAIRAQARAGEGLLRPKTAKFFGNLEMALHVTTRLEAFDSPMTIS